jgi:ectoine hydroxylase-related dioxygenase (phytanoyl-CoA dioxygenase family)
MLQSNLPWIESPFFYQILESKNCSAEQKDMARFYHEQGYRRLSGLISPALVDQVINDAREKGFNKNFEIETMRDDVRVQDLWKYSEAVRELASFQPVLEWLEFLYGREVIPFQTLNFCVGSQQRAHSDSIHFSSLPSRYMCGVWVALEDITFENGPLFYYPGSHKMPEYNFSQIKETANPTSYENYKEYEDFIEALLEVSGYKKEIFLAKKGDVLIWSSNIVHGGMPVLKPGSSRWSQVTHYFFKDSYYYTPMLSNMVTDELFLRNHLINIKTNEVVIPSYNGQKINYLKTNTNTYIVNPNMSLFHILKRYGKKYVKKMLGRSTD